jgi:hypothetical protein
MTNRLGARTETHSSVIDIGIVMKCCPLPAGDGPRYRLLKLTSSSVSRTDKFETSFSCSEADNLLFIIKVTGWLSVWLAVWLAGWLLLIAIAAGATEAEIIGGPHGFYGTDS